MELLKFVVRNQSLSGGRTKIISGSIDYVEADFDFRTDDWNGFDKWAHFSKGDIIYDVNLVDDKITRDMHLNLEAGIWEVKLHGDANVDGEVSMRITTDTAHIVVEDYGELHEGGVLPEVAASAAEQIAAKAQNALEVASAVKAAADSGEFDGEKGEDGEDGEDGYTPQKGIDYWTEEDKEEIIREAAEGIEAGADGKDGVDGVSPTVSISGDNKKTTVTITDAEGEKSFDIYNGVDGKDGAQGPQGETGPQGEKGETGAAGEDGYSPTIEVSTLANGATIKLTDKNGSTTVRIKDGADGADGAQGPQGEQGIQGEQGPAGADGTSVTVESVSESAEDGGENIVTFSDGKTLTVKNGSKGSDGEKGDTGDSGKDGEDGYTPIKGVDYFTEEDKTEMMNSIPAVYYTEQTLTEAQKAQARANIGATAGEDVEFVDSTDQMTDTSKKYVLSDGYIYAYMQKTVTVEHNANDGTGGLNVRPTGSSGSDKDANTAKNGLFTTAPIPVDSSWSSCIVNISGLEKLVPTFYASLYVYFFDDSGTYIRYLANNQIYTADNNRLTTSAEVEIPLPVSIDLTKSLDGVNYLAQSGYIRVTVGVNLSTAITDSDIEGLVINFEQLNSEETVYGWYSTGQQYSNDQATQQNSADIAALKEEVETLKEAVQKSPSQSGAVWYAIGDSITYGLYSTSATEYYQPVAGQRWVDYVAKYNGYELTNLGVSGSGFVTGTTFRTIVDRNDFSEVDLVTIMLGINDWKNESAVSLVGTMDDDISTGGTIVSELRYGLEKIIGDNPYCKIILITPINAKIGSRGTEDTNWAYGFAGSITPCGSLKAFGDKLKEVCEYYGIQVVDMTNSSVVNRKSITTVLPDGIHPNLECYEALGTELARRITFA